jgi:ATP-dependent RNA helicase RhlE
MNFSELGLTKAQLSACESLGYKTPTPIQTKAIPTILSGQDLIGCAETGTGKTAAFLLPIIQRISERSRPGVRVLVLAPTRELALQIQQNYKELNTTKSNRSVVVMGGTNIKTQISELRRGASVAMPRPALARSN